VQKLETLGVTVKYKLTDETIQHDGRTLYRIEALKDFGYIKKDDFGGFIEKEANLSQLGDCWVADSAKVYGYAKVLGDAHVSGNAQVFGNALVYDNASVFGDAEVYGYARVWGNAHVSGNAEVYDKAEVYENACVYGNAEVYGDAQVHGSAQVFGDMKIGDMKVSEGAETQTKPEVVESKVKLCNCLSRDLFIFGCRCGGK